MSTALEKKIETFTEAASNRAQQASERFDDLASRIDAGLALGGEKLQQILTRHGLEVLRAFSTGSEQATAALDEKLREFDAAVATKAGDITGALGERIEELAANVGKLDRVKAEIVDRGGGVTRELTNVGELVAQAIESRGREILQQLGEQREQLVGAIDQSTQALSTALDSASNSSIAALVSTSDKLRAELPQVVDHLSRTNNALQGIIEQAGADLSAVDERLAARLREFQGAMTGVFEQISSLETLASGSLGGAESVARRIEETQTTLAHKVAELARSQQELDETVESRRNSLVSLVSLIEEKRGEFLGTLESFSGTMEESFRHVESRAQDVGQLLTQSTQETAGVVDERFAQIRGATERERERTAAAMQAAYEQATQELSQVLNQATERFSSAAAEIRGISQEVASDLEATRAELRRGAEELPRETAEQASALRRVIGDQVKALNELTDIVARSGRTYDIAEKSQSPAALEAPAPVQAVAAELDAAPESAPRARPTPPPPPPRLQTASAKGGSGQGWLSNVLARASRDEEVEAPQPAAPERAARRPAAAGSALGNLSVEIARMVDNIALVETWRRFQRGEREGLFTRQLYTAGGRQAFEELRRRYRSEPEFRATIDTYVRNFEELLAERGRNDRDGEQSLDLLTGEAGKVYTMLAHASGRLG